MIRTDVPRCVRMCTQGMYFVQTVQRPGMYGSVCTLCRLCSVQGHVCTCLYRSHSRPCLYRPCLYRSVPLHSAQTRPDMLRCVMRSVPLHSAQTRPDMLRCRDARDRKQTQANEQKNAREHTTDRNASEHAIHTIDTQRARARAHAKSSNLSVPFTNDTQ
jgi:hypothetical protein